MPVGLWWCALPLVALAQAAPSSPGGGLQPAGPSEWQTPAFEGAGEPGAPPPSAPGTEPGSLPGPAPGNAGEAPPVVRPPPDPQRWQYPTAQLGVSGLFGQSWRVSVRVAAGVVFGRPTRAAGYVEGASGFSFAVGLEGEGGKVSIPLCGGEMLCGSRYGGGLFLRGGWGVGHIDAAGVVRPVHSLFVQVVPYLASGYIPSQPLAPGAHWGEGGLRFDVGAQSSFRWPPPGARYVAAGFFAGLNLEWLAWRRADTGAWRFGLTAGIAL